MKLTDKNLTNFIIKSIQPSIILLSLDYKILDINKAALHVYQWQKKEALGQNYLSLCEQSKLPCPIPKNKSKLLAGKPAKDIENVVEIDNQEKTVLWNIECSYDASKQPNGFMLVGEDITTLRQEEDKVFQLDSIIAQMPNNVYWCDKDFVYLGCNNNVAKTVGLSRKQAIGKSIDYLTKIMQVPPPTVAGWKNELKNIIKTGAPYLDTEEFPFRDADGKQVTQLSSKVPLFDKKGRVTGMIGISVDITEKKALEQKLAQARKLQEKSQNAKIQGMMEIAAGIAHEIRTPLTSIQCATDAKVYMDRLIAAYDMAEKAGLPVESIRPSHMEGLRNIFNSIDAEAKESMSIIDMFLSNLKNMVKEANTGDYQLCSIKESIGTALSRYPFDAKQKNSVIYTDASDFKFYGVNLLIQHIIFNLMKNALYYISDKPKAQISIWHEHGETDNFLHFKDTGPGISEYDQEHVFDFGFSKRKEGSGFGLTYCKTTIQQMGGDIAVRSEPDKYTEFVLTFPKVVE